MYCVSPVRISENCLQKEGIESSILPPKTTQKKANVILFLKVFILRLLQGFTQFPLLFKSWKAVLLINAQVRQKVIEKDGKSTILGDHFTQYLQEDIADKKDFLMLSELFPPKLDSVNPLDKKQLLIRPQYGNTLHLELILFLNLFNPFFLFQGYKRISGIRKHLKRIPASSTHIKEQHLLDILRSYRRLIFFLTVRKAALKVCLAGNPLEPLAVPTNTIRG